VVSGKKAMKNYLINANFMQLINNYCIMRLIGFSRVFEI